MMVKRVLLCGLLLPGSTAWAVDLHGHGPLGDASVQVNSDLEIRYRHLDEKLENFEDLNVLDYAEQVERINLLLVQEGLSLGVQLDEVAFFGNRYILDGELTQERDLYDSSIRSPFPDALVQLEKLWLTRRYDHVEWAVGDIYASFGRGMALNIIKNTGIDVDTSIRGIRSVVTTGDIEFSAVTGLSNTQQISQDNPNQLINEDVQHMVSGARIEHYALGPAQVGVHGVVYRFGRVADAELPPMMRYQEDLDAVVSGVTIALPSLAGVDWFVEGDLFGYQNSEISGDEDGEVLGHALYGSASFYPGMTAVLIEAKATRDTERLNTFVYTEGWEVSSVPTLEYERVITEDSAAAVNSNDILGARVRVDLAFRPGALMGYFSLAGFQDNEIGGLHFNSTPETIAHGITGLQWFEEGRVLQVNAGYRKDQREDSAEGSDRMAHLDGDLSLPIGGDDHIEFAVDMKRFMWGNNPFQQDDYTEMANGIAWHHDKVWMLQFYQDWTDNPLIRSEGNLAKNIYGALELSYKPRPGSQVKAFYGAYKAGIRCSGGQCRSLPGFEGARVSWQTVF